MKRREFLKMSPVAAASTAFMINGLPIQSFAEHPLLHLLAKQTQANGRVMVFVQLNGGNDGLNTLIPLDQYSALSVARGNILIPQNQVLPLAGFPNTGLHPAMNRVRDMYMNGMVNLVQSVSYPTPNYSHFRATDIWLTASDSNQYLDTGWLGRYLDAEYPGFPMGYPNATMPDPLAIQIGSSVSTVFTGNNVNMGMAISDINSFYNIVNNSVDPAPNTPAGHELTFLRYISQQTQQYNAVLQTAANNASNLSTQYPTGNSLSDQLKIVARLIAGGLKTPLYIVNLGSFDTHSVQVDATDHSLGTHATLLKKLSDAVYAFYDDLKLHNVDDRVATATFSEFGRRINSNSSGGTDHGTAAPVMVFGKSVNPGIIGFNPIIPTTVTTSDNLPMQHDFRSVYAAILADWFDLPTSEVNSILLRSFPIPPIFKKVNGVANTLEGGDNEALGQSAPNPMTNSTHIPFYSDGSHVLIELYNMEGRVVQTLMNQVVERGAHELILYRNDLPAGTYVYKLINGKITSSRKLLIVD
jgi:uncharacterized protein (DUF1501 family)